MGDRKSKVCFDWNWHNVFILQPVAMWLLCVTAEWIITVGHRPNSEPNLPRAEQFNERADTVAGLPASGMKGVVKRWVWQ